MSSNNNDPQAQLLYAFEDTFMYAAMRGTMRREDLQALADKACRRWRVPPVEVKFSQHTKWFGQYFAWEHVIHLYGSKGRRRGPKGTSGRNAAVLLHEVAHHIDDWRTGADQAHGPHFAAICRDLYDHFQVLPRKGYTYMARKCGLKVSKLTRSTPKFKAAKRRKW